MTSPCIHPCSWFSCWSSQAFGMCILAYPCASCRLCIRSPEADDCSPAVVEPQMFVKDCRWANPCQFPTIWWYRSASPVLVASARPGLNKSHEEATLSWTNLLRSDGLNLVDLVVDQVSDTHLVVKPLQCTACFKKVLRKVEKKDSSGRQFDSLKDHEHPWTNLMWHSDQWYSITLKIN